MIFHATAHGWWVSDVTEPQPFDIRPAGSLPWNWRYYGTAYVLPTPDGFKLKPIGKVNKGRVGVRRWWEATHTPKIPDVDTGADGNNNQAESEST